MRLCAHILAIFVIAYFLMKSSLQFGKQKTSFCEKIDSEVQEEIGVSIF